MVTRAEKIVYITDDGVEFPTEAGAVYAETRAEVKRRLVKVAVYREVAEDDVMTFILDNRDAISAWFRAKDALAATAVSSAPSQRRAATEGDEYGS